MMGQAVWRCTRVQPQSPQIPRVRMQSGIRGRCVFVCMLHLQSVQCLLLRLSAVLTRVGSVGLLLLRVHRPLASCACRTAHDLRAWLAHPFYIKLWFLGHHRSAPRLAWQLRAPP
jgi:hypothetical protein